MKTELDQTFEYGDDFEFTHDLIKYSLIVFASGLCAGAAIVSGCVILFMQPL